MTSTPQKPLPPNPKRQAAHIVSAFRFQLIETAIAWLNLPEGASLLIEIFEDFDIEAPDGGTELTQVKHSVGGRTLTLASNASREALENYWKTSRASEVSSVSLVVHTNMPIGSEQGVTLPDNMTGIDYWRAVKRGADLAPLKNLLRSTLPGGDLKTWLASNPPDDLVRARLIDRVTWKTSQPSGPPQNAILVELTAGRLAALGLPRGLAPRIASDVAQRIGAVASESDSTLRRLTVKDLHAFLHEVCRPGQPGHESGWSRASWTVPVAEIDLPAFCATRDTLLRDISNTLSESGSVWLHGASGTGKSTLAQQVARASGENWLVVEFREQKASSDVLLRLDRAYTDVVLSNDIAGVILDDLDTDIFAGNAARFGRFFKWLRERDASVIITSARPLSPATLQSASFPVSLKEAPYLTSEETIELVAQTSAPTALAEAWGSFIHLSTSSGHPQLVAAKVVSLEYRSWPKSALTEDMSGTPSEAVELTKAEARRRLLNEATDQGRMLLKRLGCIMFKFDRASAIAIAALDPRIEDAGASLGLLTGPWIEKAPADPGYLRLSPLLWGLQEDLGEDTVRQIQEGYLVSRLKRGPIPYEALDSVFWTAFVGKQGWFISKFFESSLSFDEEKSKAIAIKLGGLVFLRTDRPLLPDDPGTSHILRILQIDVAILNGEKSLFQPIAIAAMREATEVEHEKLRDAFCLMALMKILSAPGMKLDWGLRLTYLTLYETLSDKNPDLANRHKGPTVDAIKSGANEEADMSSFLLSVGLSAVESPADLKTFFKAMDQLDRKLRVSRLRQTKAFHKGYGLHVQSAWVSAWSAENIDAETAISDYEEMAALAAGWGDDDLTAECIIAQSVIWDEFQNERTRALMVVDAALEALPDHPELLRQKAKVLGHDRQYEKARDILEQIRDHTAERTDIERMYALKEQAVATANLGDTSAARNLFLDAAAAAEAVQDDVDSVRAHGVALKAEAAMCSWRDDSYEPALRELAPLIDTLQTIDPEAHQAAKILHIKLRRLIAWLFQATDKPSNSLPELTFGAIAALDVDYPGVDLDQGAGQEDVKLLLTLIGLRKIVRDLFPDLNKSETTLGLHVLLAAAEFDLALEDGEPGSVVDAMLEMVGSLTVPLKREGAATKIKPIELSDLADEKARVVIVHALALAVFFQAHNQADPRAQCKVMLDETKARLGGTTPDLERFDSILSSSAGADPKNHAEFVFAAALAPKSDTLHPADMINRQLTILQCAIACGCGARLILSIHALFADEWAFVLQHQRALLAHPALHVPAIEAAIVYARQAQPGSLLNLLQTGARALNSEIPEAWIDIAKKIGGETR